MDLLILNPIEKYVKYDKKPYNFLIKIFLIIFTAILAINVSL